MISVYEWWAQSNRMQQLHQQCLHVYQLVFFWNCGPMPLIVSMGCMFVGFDLYVGGSQWHTPAIGSSLLGGGLDVLDMPT
jgi:hypothetical protein